MEKHNIPIVMMFDDNYAIPAGAAIYSLLDNANKNYNYELFILHNNDFFEKLNFSSLAEVL